MGERSGMVRKVSGYSIEGRTEPSVSLQRMRGMIGRKADDSQGEKWRGKQPDCWSLKEIGAFHTR